MPSPWSTQQLAEFVAAVSAAPTEAAASRVAVERAAEALDAEVAAIVADGDALAAVGFPEGRVPVADLLSVSGDEAPSQLSIAGLGPSPATAVPLDYPPGGTLVVARVGPERLSREEASLLRGMAHVTSTTLQALRLLTDERAARKEVERLAQEHMALRRVATLVAEQRMPDAIFSAVAEEVGHLFSAGAAAIGRYDPGGVMTIVAGWSQDARGLPAGMRTPLEGEGDATVATVLRSGRAARLDDFTQMSGAIAAFARSSGLRSCVGAPIVVGGQIWGVMLAYSTSPALLPPETEHRLAAFTELVEMAISNAESRTELTESRARIVTAGDEARRRIERDLHDGAQQRLVSLALELTGALAAVPPELPEARAALIRVRTGLTGALDELANIARGIHPAALTAGGIAPALRTLARRSPIPVALSVTHERRLPAPVEVAVYYAVSEMLTNAAKHAQASEVEVEVEVAAADGLLHLTIRDNGVGGADPARGTGLIGLKDRVEAIGGRMSLVSEPGSGTHVRVQLPIEASRAPVAAR